VAISATSATLGDGTLAGSILTMDRALQNFAQAVRRPFEELWKITSGNAARAIHVADRKGSIEIGKDADIVLLDPNGRVHATIVGGRVVYQKESE
jgi:N-acetylglucosamine-6-phosphate deacetylase